jgi:xanthine dehydrogenase D subunit/xanthine dehydrogenase C subunit
MISAPRIIQPNSLADAVALMARDSEARFIAAGTAVQLEWAKGVLPPKTLISLGKIPELCSVERRGGRVRIGAMATLGDLERDKGLGAALPLLTSAILTVAAPSIRNLATVGGNVAGRAGCLIPALLTLDAMLEGIGVAGPWRRTLQDWLLHPMPPGELITAIVIPVSAAICRWTQRKIGLRAAFTPSIIGVAGVLDLNAATITAARLAVGGGIVTPARLIAAEAWLAGKSLHAVEWAELRERLTDEIVAPDDAFRTGRYRKLVASNALVAGLGGPLPVLKRSKRRVAHTSTARPSGETLLARSHHPARWHIRPDGPAKVAGSFAYLTDHRMSDMLVGRILRAGRPHARIVAIDTRQAEELPGVVAVVTHRDVPGLNAFGIVVQDQPAFCHDKVRYVGDVVAAVAAVDAETAEAALALIDVTYEPLPVVTDPEQALAPDAPLVHASGNLQRVIDFARGDVKTGFAACSYILEDTYRTPRQMHGFMETEGGWAALRPNGSLEVHAGGQHAARDRLQLSRILGMPEDRIRVVTSPTGGAFGGKDELTVQPALALLALKTGRPVRIKLSRAESVQAGTKRHPMMIRMRTGCDKDGKILAQQVDLLADAGAYASLGPGVLETALEHAAGVYAIPTMKTRGRLAYTNNGVCGAFRGFGANQMNYAVECQIDRLAERCGLSPLEMRWRNVRQPGTGGYFGQAVAPSERLVEMIEAAEASPLWQAARGGGLDDEIIGVGMAMNYHGNGLGSVVPDPAGGRLRLAKDGRIEAVFTLDEMGQGLLTSIVATVSEQLGCGRDDIRPVTGDSAAGPDSGSTAAARSSFVVWQTTRLAAPVLSGKLCAAAAKILGRDADTLMLVPGGIADRLSNSDDILLSFADLAQSFDEDELPTADISFDYPRTDYTAGNARFLFVYGACVARVAVNRISGQIRVLDLNQHSAAGPVLDIAAYLGQQEGGAVQGMGSTLTEDALIRDGEYLTGNFDSYMMPGIADAPERMVVYALEDLDANDPYGPRGVGELGIGAVTPAIVNAVFDATGMCPTVTPISPESILSAMSAGR